LEFLAAQTVSAGDDSVEMELPSDVVGQVVVRARPLHGAERQQVRGGSTSVWVSPGNPLDVQVALNASTDQAQVAFGGTARDDRSVYLLALPIDEAQGLFTRLRQEALGPLGQLRQSPAEATAALVEAALAAEVPRDASAPALLRPGEGLIAVPSPDNPLALGLLRDPWRSRARFVTGRLALIFRAIEDHVAQALPQRIDDVSVRSSNNEWRFNAEIVDAVAQSGGLGSSGATGLGGEPLTIEALQQFDRAFNYNNVARRITRQRLFRIIVALRHFVQRNGFDLPWSRLGDPAEWLRALPGQPVPGSQSLRAEDLVDGWARPFRLQRAAGATRFGLVSPLGGWEVVSAGPDGRVGTADDLWDPTGRVLPSGGGYARAAGEDVLLARLRGVELGRATVEHLRRAGDNLGRSVRSVPPRPEAATEQLTRRLWYRLPSLVEPPLEALALRRPQEPGDGALGRTVTMPVGGGTVAMGLDEEPRTWGLLAYAWSRDGFPALALAATPAAAPLLVEGERPARIVVDQPVFLGLHLTNLTDRDQRVEATVHSSGALRAGSLEPVVLEAQTAGRGYLRLEGQSLGEGSVTVQFSDPSGAPLGRFELNLQVVSGHAPVRLRHGAALTDDRWQTRLPIPADAQAPLAGRVVVLAPRGLVLDPDLMDLRQRDPALIAWAYVLAGHPLDPALQAALLRAQEPSGTVDGSEPILSTACALLPWSAAGTDDEEATAALLRARRALSGISPFIDDNAEVGALRTAAAVLAAVAPGGIPEIAALREGGLDPVARHAARLRTSLRRAIHAYPEEPSLLARAAAALLLADPRDGHGRAMVDRAAAHLEELDGGLRLVPSEERRTLLESLTGTLALAIAAHQVERDELARRLIRGAFHSENVLTRVGGETGFWYLATAAYGALGASLPERVTVTTSGGKREVDLDQGRAVVPLENLRPGRRATVAVDRIGGPILLVRAEAVMGRPFRDRQQGPLQLELHGDVGQTGELAALELTVRADEAVDQPVLDIQLPAGIAVSDPLRESLLNGGQIRDMEPRRPGFLRVWLAPMAAGTTLVLPLPLRWTLSGELRGLGVLAYPRSAPAALTVLAPRDVSLPPSR
jgi:hypothetical protein